MLIIFLVVSIVVVGRIQASLSQAHEATFMYELSSALMIVNSEEDVARTVARHLQRLYLANQVNVVIRSTGQSSKIVASEPPQIRLEGQPRSHSASLDCRGPGGRNPNLERWLSGIAA